MEAVSTSVTLVNFSQANGAKTQKTAISREKFLGAPANSVEKNYPLL
jgi:hypothetical protein